MNNVGQYAADIRRGLRRPHTRHGVDARKARWSFARSATRTFQELNPEVWRASFHCSAPGSRSTLPRLQSFIPLNTARSIRGSTSAQLEDQFEAMLSPCKSHRLVATGCNSDPRKFCANITAIRFILTAVSSFPSSFGRNWIRVRSTVQVSPGPPLFFSLLPRATGIFTRPLTKTLSMNESANLLTRGQSRRVVPPSLMAGSYTPAVQH